MTISPAEMEVGGLERNPLINRKANLILISRSQLVGNRKTFAVSESEDEKGEQSEPNNSQWRATIVGGTFETPDKVG